MTLGAGAFQFSRSLGPGGREAAATLRRVQDALGEGECRRPRGGRCCAGPELEGEAVGRGSSVPPGVAAARPSIAAGFVLQLWEQHRQTSREEDSPEQGGCGTRNGGGVRTGRCRQTSLGDGRTSQDRAERERVVRGIREENSRGRARPEWAREGRGVGRELQANLARGGGFSARWGGTRTGWFEQTSREEIGPDREVEAGRGQVRVADARGREWARPRGGVAVEGARLKVVRSVGGCPGAGLVGGGGAGRGRQRPYQHRGQRPGGATASTHCPPPDRQEFSAFSEAFVLFWTGKEEKPFQPVKSPVGAHQRGAVTLHGA